MATQSFLNSVTLRGRKEAQDFVRAIERSENYEIQKSTGYKPVIAKDMDDEMIRKIFCRGAEESE